MLTKRVKSRIVGENKKHDTDTGSAQVQIAMTTRQIDELAAHLKKNPKDPSALLQRATRELDSGNIDGADKDVKALLDLKAFSPLLTFDQARIAGARGETVRQGDLLAEALRSNPQFLPARLELSRLLVASGKAKDAIGVLDQASPADMRTPNYVFYRNTALMAAGEWDQAKKGIIAGLGASPTARFLYQDAVLRMKDHDLAGARKSLDAAFQLTPDAATLILLGEVMRRQKEFPAYVTLLKGAAAKSPGSVPLQRALAGALAAQGDWKGTQTALEAAKAAGDTVDSDFDLAELELRAGSPDQAKKRLLDLVARHDNAKSRLLLAQIETLHGSPDAVIQDYLKALALEPQNGMAMNNLAAFLAAQKKFDDALFWAQKALAQAPNSPVIEDTIGWTYFRQAKYGDALPFLEKSLKGLDRPVAHYHLAAVLLNTGDPVRAKKEYNLALKEDPKSPERSAIGPLFESGKH